MASYGTATEVEQIFRVITVGSAATDVITSAALDAVGEAHTKPIVDAALNGYGAPWSPTTDAPDLVIHIDALLIAAHIFDDVHYQVKSSTAADNARTRAWDLIGKIKSGEIAVSGLTAVSPHSAVDPADDRLDEETFVDKGGKEKDWKYFEEERESD
jgi:hypothetical protein